MPKSGFYLNGLFAALWLVAAGMAYADGGAGQVQYIAGTLSVQRPDGSTKIYRSAQMLIRAMC